jgi:hypothetical protein
MFIGSKYVGAAELARHAFHIGTSLHDLRFDAWGKLLKTAVLK